MNLHRVSAAARVILAAQQTGATLATPLAVALEAEQLLQLPVPAPEKTTPTTGAEVTAAAVTARTTVLSALARALREQPTGARILDALDALGEVLVQEGDGPEARSWADGIALLAGLPAAPGDGLTVYRAAHDSISCGLYTTAAAAQQHCEVLISREYPEGVPLFFEWCVDEDETEELPGIELDVMVGGEHVSTGYYVTPVPVADAYDPDADE
ncbi:hypothetical protein [Streptomyces sp. NPDC059783]|uniref:hypothetical protein n=1 Tax=Streptomyces sp. NPDC059783 TaxID=3346944 RepID=UPI00365E29A3